MDRFLQDRRTFFIADEGYGGGGDDPHDHDDFLAALFKEALGRAQNSSTPNPPRLIESVENILERLENVGRMTVLLSRDLQPIAKRIIEIQGYSDKRNPVILQDRFKDFDLQIAP